MKSILFQFVIMAVVALVFVMTAVQSYWNHADTREKFDRISELLINPKARPDAWTKTMDDNRSRSFCVPLIMLSKEAAPGSEFYKTIPAICKQQYDISLSLSTSSNEVLQ